jgi:hypothetical protein
VCGLRALAAMTPKWYKLMFCVVALIHDGNVSLCVGSLRDPECDGRSGGLLNFTVFQRVSDIPSMMIQHPAAPLRHAASAGGGAR